jgi:hypothetical protein
MAVRLSFPNVKALGSGVWKAKLAPEDLYLLGGEATRRGALSVVLLSSTASFDRATNTLSISSAFIRVLNLGSTNDTIIVEGCAPSERDLQSSFPWFAIELPGQCARPITTLPRPLNGDVHIERPPVTHSRMGANNRPKYWQSEPFLSENPEYKVVNR